MSLEFRPPDRISLSGNLADNWRLWKQGFMLFMTATESDGKADKIKIAMLLASIGPEALDRFNQFTFDAASGEDRESYDQVLLKFEKPFQRPETCSHATNSGHTRGPNNSRS